MVEFELRGVYGGWDQAVFGPSDQVDYAIRTGDGESLASYDSVHTLLRLYDLARLERSVHPAFLGVVVTERDGVIEVDVHGLRFRTTYGELRSAMEPFVADLFAGLDRETAGDPDPHVRELDDSGQVLADLPALRDELG